LYKEIIMLHPRARTMLLLAIPALIIGVASSLVLIVVMKVASVLQTCYGRASCKLGVTADSPAWIVGMLTLTGIAVGLVIRFSPGHAGPDPALEPLIGAPVAPRRCRG
jgi:uncharacterized membrane protein YjgN (DUF898 family)